MELSLFQQPIFWDDAEDHTGRIEGQQNIAGLTNPIAESFRPTDFRSLLGDWATNPFPSMSSIPCQQRDFTSLQMRGPGLSKFDYSVGAVCGRDYHRPAYDRSAPLATASGDSGQPHGPSWWTVLGSSQTRVEPTINLHRSTAPEALSDYCLASALEQLLQTNTANQASLAEAVIPTMFSGDTSSSFAGTLVNAHESKSSESLSQSLQGPLRVPTSHLSGVGRDLPSYGVSSAPVNSITPKILILSARAANTQSGTPSAFEDPLSTEHSTAKKTRNRRSVSPSQPISPDSAFRKQYRRDSSAAYRKRRKEYLSYLQRRESELTVENRRLREEVFKSREAIKERLQSRVE